MMDVVYLCGGVGVRANLGYPKQFMSLQGKPLLMHGLETLRKSNLGKIIIPGTGEVNKLCNQYNIRNYMVCEAGETRQDSVFIGLKYVTTEEVLICEAVRPFITNDLINEIMSIDYDFVVPITKSYATVLDKIGNVYDRDIIGEVQTPQKYNTEMLNHGHVLARNNEKYNYTDDAALIIGELQKSPLVICGQDCNIKITTPLDIYIADAIYKYMRGKHDE